MDLEDIDAWFKEEKTKLTEKYRKDLAHMHSKFTPPSLDEDNREEVQEKIALQQKEKRLKADKIKARYEKNMKKLQDKYEKLSQKRIDKNLRLHFLRHKIHMLKHKIFWRYYDWKDMKKRDNPEET